MTTNTMKRIAGKVLVAGGLALAASGFVAGTAQAGAPPPPFPPPPPHVWKAPPMATQQQPPHFPPR